MSDSIEGKKVAFLVANEGVEQIELTRPWEAVEQAGGEPVLIAPEAGKVQGFEHLDKGKEFEATVTAEDADAGSYDALVLPGGVANPDILRTVSAAVDFTRAFFEAGKPVAAICHGPWTLIEAGVVDGRTLTSWPSLQTDIRNAGGEWVDEEVHVDAGLVTSRKPEDLDAFCAKLVEEVAEGVHSKQREATLSVDRQGLAGGAAQETEPAPSAARASARVSKRPTALSIPVSSSIRRTSRCGQQTPNARPPSSSVRFASTIRLSPVESMNSQALRSTRTEPPRSKASESTLRSCGAVPWSSSPTT